MQFYNDQYVPVIINLDTITEAVHWQQVFEYVRGRSAFVALDEVMQSTSGKDVDTKI